MNDTTKTGLNNVSFVLWHCMKNDQLFEKQLIKVIKKFIECEECGPCFRKSKKGNILHGCNCDKLYTINHLVRTAHEIEKILTTCNAKKTSKQLKRNLENTIKMIKSHDFNMIFEKEQRDHKYLIRTFFNHNTYKFITTCKINGNTNSVYMSKDIYDIIRYHKELIGKIT
jgi:hypothetical protein